MASDPIAAARLVVQHSEQQSIFQLLNEADHEEEMNSSNS